MLKYLGLTLLGITVSAQQCCDRRASECQSRYQFCMSSTNGNFQQCDSVFCKSEPYPLPTECCDQQLPECQMKLQQCMAGTFGSFSLCGSTFCPITEPTRVPESTPIPVPSIPELQSPIFTRLPDFGSGSAFPCCSRTSEICTMAYNGCKQEGGGMFCESMFCDSSPMPSPPPTDFTCCERDTDTCQQLHSSCVTSGGNMCDMMYCDRSPLPSRKPKPFPRFSAFPSPKFLRALPSILPKEIRSSIQMFINERKEIENITKIKEIQVKISCSLRMPVDNIRIKNITFIDSKGTRTTIIFNETAIDDADIPIIDCMVPGLRRLQNDRNTVDIAYIVVDPTPELLAYGPVDIQLPSNSQSSSTSGPNTLIGAVVGSIAGTLALVTVGTIMYRYFRPKPKHPVSRQSIRIVVVENSNPLNIVPATNNAQKVAFTPMGSRV